MVDKIIKLIIVVNFIGCSTLITKKNNVSPKVNEIENVKNAVQTCDTIAMSLLKYPSKYELAFNNINLNEQIKTDMKEGEFIYKFKFNGNPIFDGYQLQFEGRREDNSVIKTFTIDADVTDDYKIEILRNNDVIFNVKQDDLANFCSRSRNENGYEVVYTGDFRIKIRGKICNFYGPYSDPLEIKFSCHN